MVPTPVDIALVISPSGSVQPFPLVHTGDERLTVLSCLAPGTRPRGAWRAVPRAGAAQAPAAATPEELKAGKFIYTRGCANCHGEQGKGDGIAAPLLDPRPRDFAQGKFKFRTTPNGQVPTLDDLARTVSHGLTGTAMGQWSELSAQDRRAVLLYVRSLSERFKTETGAPITVPPEPPLTLDSVKRGAKWYTEVECNKCHGNEGRGDGPSAAELKDDWDKRPIRPADLTQGHRFKRGATAQDIYLTLFAGLTGTPMPSYASTLPKPEDEWDLVHYVYWLSQGKSLAGK